MEREFTLLKYRKLLEQIPKGNYTVRGSLIDKNQYGIIRHDVDRPPHNVIKIAEIEKELGIQSTYYFRFLKKHFVSDIILKVKLLGHEIGYHYEVLDKAHGNVDKALEIFNKEWMSFKQWNSETACAHGNPLTKNNNLDIWKFYSFEEFGIIGEAYLSIDFNKYIYFSDVGRRWNSPLVDENKKKIKFKTVNQLANFLINNRQKNIYILTHPSRWNDNYLWWLRELVFQFIKNIAKIIIKYIRA